jgi:predicted ATPase
MISEVRFEGFKSWRDTGAVRFAPITALFGNNSSGKTSLLQTLLMLKQTAESTDRTQVLNLGDDRALVDLGTLPDILYSHDLTVPLRVALKWTLPQALEVPDPADPEAMLFQGKTLSFRTAITAQGSGDGVGRASVMDLAYGFAGAEFGMRPAKGKKSKFELFETAQDFSFVRTVGRPWDLPAPAKCYGFPDQVRAYFQNAGFLSDFELQFEELFGRVFYLGPLRDYPRRQYSWAGAKPADMGRRGERVVDAILASREAGITYSRGRGHKRQSLEERVASWLQDLGLIYRFEVRPIAKGGKLFQVWVRRNPKAPDVLITDVGFGVSQILPVLTLCYYAPEGSTLILEQPEIHLHPRVQAGLADVFIDASRTRGVQIILESHSEHLLRRLQRRIAEEQFLADEAALYFAATKDGESQLATLELDLFGTIKNWPEGFFGDDLEEIAATSKAVLKRQSQTAR